MSPSVNSSDEIQMMRKLHGNIVLDEAGFLKKVTQKDSKLNKQAAERYYSNWANKKEAELEDNESYVEGRRGQAQNMTNAFYDLVTDFYEYGMGKTNTRTLIMIWYRTYWSVQQVGASRSILQNFTKVIMPLPGDTRFLIISI